MSESVSNDNKTGKEVLRVALDSESTQAYKLMEKYLRETNQHVSFHPSEFISFLVKDYFKTYFDRDVGILVAEFFDSKSYYEEQLKNAKSKGNFEEVMDQAIDSIKRIKNKKRGKQGRKRKALKELNANNHETL